MTHIITRKVPGSIEETLFTGSKKETEKKLGELLETYTTTWEELASSKTSVTFKKGNQITTIKVTKL